MKYLLILTTMLFADQMEVQGDLKVTGTVDANGNPITNVGAPLSMTDAINGNVLQDALRDDGVYEYKLIWIGGHHTSSNTFIYYKMDEGDLTQYSNLTSYMNSLELEGWEFLRGSILSFGNTPLLVFRKELND